MADAGSRAFGIRLDIHKIQLDAQIRWLRPSEISEILQNYRQFHITAEAPSRPPSGSLFLFDRKVLRYFRKDGHNWRKKKDGKTVKEAHEKLKVGSVDAIHCYYAHGEANESFQRRSYWLLEQDYMHIVLVHYLEVKGNKASISNAKENEIFSSSINSWTSISPENSKESHSINTDSTSPTSTLASLCEDAESEDGHQAVSNFRQSDELSQNKNDCLVYSMNSGDLNPFLFNSDLDPHGCFNDNELLKFSVPNIQYSMITGCGDVNETMRNNGDILINHNYGSWDQGIIQNSSFGASQLAVPVSQPNTTGSGLEQAYSTLYSIADDQFVQPGFRITTPVQVDMMVSAQRDCSSVPQWAGDEKLHLDGECELNSRFEFQQVDALPSSAQLSGSSCDQHENFSENGIRSAMSNEFNNAMELYPEKNGYSNTAEKFLLDGLQSESLKKVDSFSKWISKELGEVEELNLKSNCGSYWGTIESSNTVDSSQLQLDTFSLTPSLSQDQLFSIVDFSPCWAYTDSETKVLISGVFLINKEEIIKYKWSCMFGEVEIPVTVLSDCVLRCRAPPGIVGRVPFYITCSNRLACSEIREFEYKEELSRDVDSSDAYGCKNENFLQIRFEKLLNINSADPPETSIDEDKLPILNKVIHIMENGESYKMDNPTSSHAGDKEVTIQKLMKDKLYSWLFYKVTEKGRGPSILGDDGQGVLHLAAALAYDWAIQPIITAGVNINFRDINGWTSLHWASYCGRECTVALLVSLGAASGALTDPSPKFPLGRTPADLASANGFKGISGFLAESSLTSYLSSLSIDTNEAAFLENTEMKAVQTVSERTATPTNVGDVLDVLSLRDSLTAVCNATQAADRIHQVFRMQSFREKQAEGAVSNDLLDVNTLPIFSLPARISGKADAAVIRIQKKFRGWKRRKEFLLIRQRIVKIQAHVRGHQARKHYKTIIWSVGIMEKVILRWRRKGTGLRGYRPEALSESFSSQQVSSKDDDYDFLKEGRKQAEERYQKALARVKSMAYYPEGRDQYRRLLTVVECFRKNKVEEEGEMASGKEMFDFEKLVGDDVESFMEI